MRSTPRRLILTFALVGVPRCCPCRPIGNDGAGRAKRPIELKDIIEWKAIGATSVSNDGQWFGYRMLPAKAMRRSS